MLLIPRQLSTPGYCLHSSRRSRHWPRPDSRQHSSWVEQSDKSLLDSSWSAGGGVEVVEVEEVEEVSYWTSRHLPEFLFTMVAPTMSHFWGQERVTRLKSSTAPPARTPQSRCTAPRRARCRRPRRDSGQRRRGGSCRRQPPATSRRAPRHTRPPTRWCSLTGRPPDQEQ